MGDPSSLSEILWSSDPVTRSALFRILALVVPIAALVFAPLIARATRLWLLERRLRDTLDEYDSKGEAAQRAALREWLRNSLIRRQYEEFERRWNTAQLVEGGQRAPIRLLDVLEDQPLLPFGPRRSLLPVLPGLFLGIGVFGALLGLIPSVTSGLAAPAAGMADPLAMALGLALRATAWGFALAIAASLTGRLIEGSFEARGRGLDEVLVSAHPAVSPGELAEITRQTQQRSLETLGRELTQFAHELNERLERGLQRIEQSSARAASLVSQEQRGALHSVVQELSLAVRQGVEHHLTELRVALQRTADYQSSVTTGLSETFERMIGTAQVQDRVARTLTDTANALDALRQEIRPAERAPAKSEPSPAPAPRERTWSPAASSPAKPPAPQPSTPIAASPGTASPQRATALAGFAASEGAAGLARPSVPATPVTPAPASPAADVASIEGPIGRELSLSGFRVGAPRAQGPDPSERLGSAVEAPSNVRHFPTRDRELGDELKLSGLLGPSAPITPAPAAPARREPAAAQHADERSGANRPDEED